MKTLAAFMIFNLAMVFMLSAASYAAEVSADAIVLKIELRGDDTLANTKAHDQAMMDKYTDYLRQILDRKTALSILSDQARLTAINQAESDYKLQQCNGCDLQLARQLGARYVVVPWVFRMSILVQTMYIEVRNAENEKVISHIGRNFRGNSDDAWQHAIDSLILDLATQYPKLENH